MATSRNSSIELLRIFAIFGIVTMHINGELMSSAQGSTAAWIQLENSLFNAGVSVFVLISGYYGIRRTWHKAAVLEITAIVYSALTALLSSMQGGGTSLKVVLQAFIPISTNQYWFLSCYMLLMLFAPYINDAVQCLRKDDLKRLILLMVAVFYVLPTVIYYHVLGTGKNAINMLTLYLLGSYLRKYASDEDVSNKALVATYASSTFAILLLNCAASAVTGSVHIPFARDCSIFVLLQAVSLFIMFKRYNFASVSVNGVSRHVLAAYLFEGAFRASVLPLIIDVGMYQGSEMWPALSILISLLTITACVLIDVPIQRVVALVVDVLQFLVKRVLRAD